MQLMFGSFLLGISRLKLSDPNPQFIEAEVSTVV
jgi:hypothetical protein